MFLTQKDNGTVNSSAGVLYSTINHFGLLPRAISLQSPAKCVTFALAIKKQTSYCSSVQETPEPW